MDPTAKSEEERRLSKSLQLPTLFTTVLESNALLREEIDRMEDSECTAFDMQRHSSGTEKRNIRRQGSGKESHFEKKLLLLTAASKEEDVGLEKDSESDVSSQEEETDTDEMSESDEEDNKATSSLSTVQQPCDQLNSGDLRVPLSITSLSSTEICSTVSGSCSSEGDLFASPGQSTIETMWDNFSVDEYAPPLKQKEKDKKCVSEPVQQEWSHRVTIPQPFTMMIRESAKPKKKSKALIIAEQEKFDRELQEEVECHKKFRALPVPATTYIPLHELSRRENHKQQPQVECTNEVVHSIRPFSFMKREEEKRQRKLEALNKGKKADKRVFKAKPTPQNILSPQISEQLKEKEEYRRILIRVRSQEMLAQAELPKNMQVKGREYTVGKLRKETLENRQSSAFVTKEHTFHPKIKPTIPDHDYLYSQFQQQLAAKRELRPPTTPKPFLLRTSSTPSPKVHIPEEHSKSSSLKSLGRSGTSVDTLHSRSGSCRPMYSIQMTQAAKLRQSVNERKLAEDTEKEAEAEEVRRSKREQQRELRNRVVERVQSYDHSAWLQEKQREKLQELRSRHSHTSFACSSITGDNYGIMFGIAQSCYSSTIGTTVDIPN